jgi:hypothetical protein
MIFQPKHRRAEDCSPRSLVIILHLAGDQIIVTLPYRPHFSDGSFRTWKFHTILPEAQISLHRDH